MGKSGQISGLDVMNRITGIISTNLENIQAPDVTEDQKKMLQYSNLTWLSEMRKVLEEAGEEMFSSQIKEYIDCVRNNKKINNGNIYDAIEVMKMIDTIYKSDSKWRKKFFNS